MKDMDKISVKFADYIYSIMMERAELKKELAECESNLCSALVNWAEKSTGVREGYNFLFRGKKAALTGWNIIGLPENNDLESAAKCIGALVRMDPTSFDGPRSFEHNEISAKDFEPLEEDDYEKA